MKYLFLLFVAVPFVEMLVLIEVGQVIGTLNTIGLVILTAIVGVSLLKNQGVATLFSARQKMESGQLPGTEMVEGILLAVAGALMLTPGFVTDSIGLLLMLPFVRKPMVSALLAKGMFTATSSFTQSHPFQQAQHDEHIIEGEVVDKDK